MARFGWLVVVIIAVAVAACGSPDGGSGSTPDVPSPVASPTASATASPTATATASATASAEPTGDTAVPAHTSPQIRATRLLIPSHNLDAEVVLSYTTPDVRAPYPGCPAPPEGGQTLTVSNFGIATPEQAFDGLDHVAWIFGHSRWQGAPGLFMLLQDLKYGDVLLVDGVDRLTGDPVERRRYVVEGIFLADRESGGRLVTAKSGGEVTRTPVVILQTSVREWGADRPWIFDQQRVMDVATNVVEGDLDDPCKYLLLFVIARLS